MTSIETDRAQRTALRRARAEELSVDAARVRAEIIVARNEREAKTDRLRTLRLAKEAADRAALAALPPKPKSKRRKLQS